jgi:hypothetical protein
MTGKLKVVQGQKSASGISLLISGKPVPHEGLLKAISGY